MSEEIALAAADLAYVAQLREERDEYKRALAVAMEENDGWRRLAAIHQQKAETLESQLGAAYAEIARLTEALKHAARMFTIKGARRIVADALGKEGGPNEQPTEPNHMVRQ